MQAMGIPVDNPTKELLIAPHALLSMPNPQGDCDDFSMLVATFLIAAGLRASFITICADPQDPDKWSHVYVKAYWNGGSMYMDASHGEYPGWEYGAWIKKREWNI